MFIVVYDVRFLIHDVLGFPLHLPPGRVPWILITNKKIKVLLSRKRCRGTLQDYNKGEISKCQSNVANVAIRLAPTHISR